jgi:hypothetical protein
MGTIRELLERYKEASLKDGHQERGTDSSVLIAETAERRPSKDCHEFWRGIHQEVSKREEVECRVKVKSDDPAFSQRDEELRARIAGMLAEPEVDFSAFSRLVYQWRDLHLPEICLPDKKDVSIPEWKEKTSASE